MANVSLIQRMQQDGKMVVSLPLYNCDVNAIFFVLD